MTEQQSTDSPSLSERVSSWLEDPFASALLATGTTFTAVCVVMSGMWVVSSAIS